MFDSTVQPVTPTMEMKKLMEVKRMQVQQTVSMPKKHLAKFLYRSSGELAGQNKHCNSVAFPPLVVN
jgi:TorA maturation chaperone TorD